MAATQVSSPFVSTVSSPISTSAVSRLMMTSAVREHLRAWIEQIGKFLVGAVMAAIVLFALGGPGLPFLAAFSAALGALYLVNLADVVRYRDAIFFMVPTLFVWSLLAVDFRNSQLLALTWFTHVFLGFVGSFVRVSGGLAELRLWSMLLGFALVNLVYLAGGAAL